MAVARLFRGPFTVDDYQRLGECGILHEDSRVELIDGQVVPMSPIGERHAGRVNFLNETLVRLVGTQGIVTVQNPSRSIGAPSRSPIWRSSGGARSSSAKPPRPSPTPS